MITKLCVAARMDDNHEFPFEGDCLHIAQTNNHTIAKGSAHILKACTHNVVFVSEEFAIRWMWHFECSCVVVGVFKT